MPSILHGEPKCPESINAFLRRFGGLTPFDSNKYRVVHTSTVYSQRGGEWHDWDSSLAINERGGFTEVKSNGVIIGLRPSMNKPIRVVVEVREFPKYAAIPNAWVLERWCPASYYGPRESWESQHVPGFPNIPLLGAYPEKGDYELISGPSSEVPTESVLMNAIQQHNWLKEHEVRGQLEAVVAQRVRDAEREYAAEEERWTAKTELKVRDSLLSLSTCSLEAGRYRQQLANAAGIKGHAGN